jgi:tetratricopeptide (TPR) repeat protein
MWLSTARGYLEFVDGNPGGAIRCLDHARELAERTGAGFGGAMAAMFSVVVHGLTGNTECAEDAAREAIAYSRPLGVHAVTHWSTFFLMFARLAVGQPLHAVEAPLRALIEEPDVRLVVEARCLLGRALLEAGRCDEAMREVRQALAVAAPFPREHALVLHSRALIELALGHAEEALASIEHGLALIAHAPYLVVARLMRIAQIDALLALNRGDEARVLIQQVRASIVALADTLDPSMRAACLTRVVAHAHLFALS